MKKIEEMSSEELIKFLNSRKGWHGNQYRSACGKWLGKNGNEKVVGDEGIEPVIFRFKGESNKPLYESPVIKYGV